MRGKRCPFNPNELRRRQCSKFDAGKDQECDSGDEVYGNEYIHHDRLKYFPKPPASGRFYSLVESING